MVKAFGIKIDTYTVQEFTEKIIEDIESGKRGIQVTGINMRQVSLLNSDSEFAGYCNSSDYVNIDGTSVSLYLKIKGCKEAKRALCADIFYELLDYAEKKADSVYFLGASQDVADRMVRRIHELYPNINIVGYKDGYYRNEGELVEEIRHLRPTFLFIGMPSPAKERFISKYKDEMDVAVCFGVGGMFDIIAGKSERAPVSWQKIGMEWLYRTMQNPRAHAKRIFGQIGPFLYVLIKDLFGGYDKV